MIDLVQINRHTFFLLCCWHIPGNRWVNTHQISLEIVSAYGGVQTARSCCDSSCSYRRADLLAVGNICWSPVSHLSKIMVTRMLANNKKRMWTWPNWIIVKNSSKCLICWISTLSKSHSLSDFTFLISNFTNKLSGFPKIIYSSVFYSCELLYLALL